MYIVGRELFSYVFLSLVIATLYIPNVAIVTVLTLCTGWQL